MAQQPMPESPGGYGYLLPWINRSTVLRRRSRSVCIQVADLETLQVKIFYESGVMF